MALLGNWVQQASGDEITNWGNMVIIARNGAILEIAVTDADQWEIIHTFPATEGEFYPIDLPTDTRLRVSGGGAWTWSRYNIKG